MRSECSGGRCCRGSRSARASRSRRRSGQLPCMPCGRLRRVRVRVFWQLLLTALEDLESLVTEPTYMFSSEKGFLMLSGLFIASVQHWLPSHPVSFCLFICRAEHLCRMHGGLVGHAPPPSRGRAESEADGSQADARDSKSSNPSRVLLTL